ncbi:sulfatase-like hydrolase/transferase [Halorientalis marina]|uniref:sulfatase-like hydrolase/transferase n=1 Tax=Halorientalis marina TaxID=2931976 RepID=UPI001FF6A254|nr:sulfatase-like hydrolase/transferase [Halorientalis marina]
MFLISIDSLRYDYLDALDPVLRALGDETIVPTEPRVQGTATQQSHGSMLTGTHPSIHGLAHDTIDAGLPTIAELLAADQYRCSACVSTGNLSPGFGFDRGFHRYEHQEMDWETRVFNARSIVDTAIDWLETDLEAGHRVFQFIHLFDAHYPYTPSPPVSTESNIDFDLSDRTLSLAAELQDTQMEPIDVADTPLLEGDVERWQRNYRRSLRYIADQLTHFVHVLGQQGILDESLVILTGDHGEEFFEHGYVFHNSLHDENIRPGMAIKPPLSAEFTVPDRPDAVDFMPTIATLAGIETPAVCGGQAWQQSDRATDRITERLTPDAYQIAVELQGEKAIFTYESNYPAPPTDEQIADGPREIEYYELRGEVPREQSMPTPTVATEEAFRDVAERHIGASRRERVGDTKTVSESVKRRLSELGYK